MPSKVGSIQVYQRPVLPVARDPKYTGFNPSSTLLPAGHKRTHEYRAFPVDTIFDRDVGLQTRDGTILRADVYRPANETQKVPAIVAWGPYGKSGSGFLSLDIMFRRMGIPRHMVSGYESFEAPDPAEWTQRGYAIVNVDARGTFDSEGDLWCGDPCLSIRDFSC
jgi:predicted acyl esterase